MIRLARVVQDRYWTVASIALVNLGVVAELRQKFSSSWRPTGDDAIFAIHAHDVFSTKSPMLGTYSVVTQSSGRAAPPVYHLGPLVSWVLAVPERLFSERLGIAIGAGLVNIAMLTAFIVVVQRLASPRVGALVSCVVAIAAWSVGRNTLGEPWNPYIGLWALPLLAALCIAWGSGRARSGTVPWLVFVASFAIQAHYLFLGPVAATVGATVMIAILRRHGLARRSKVIALVVATVVWLPTIVQEFVGSPGNLSSWWHATSASSEHSAPFLSFGLRFVVNAIGIVPIALRGPLSVSQLVRLGHSPSLLTWTVNVCVVFVVVCGSARGWKHQRVSSMLAVVTIAMIAGCSFTLSRYPTALVVFPYYRIVMCWIASTIVWVSAVVCVAEWMPRAPWKRWMARQVVRRYAWLIIATPMVVCALIIATAHSPMEPVDDLGARATASLVKQTLTRVPRTTALTLVGTGYRGAFAVYGVFRELLAHDVHVYVPNDEVQLRRDYGVGSRSTPRLVVMSGALDAPAGTTRFARFDGRSAEEARRFETLRDRASRSAGDRERFALERFGIEQSEFVVYLQPASR